MAERLYTIPVTCCRDGQAHDVTDESMAAGRGTGDTKRWDPAAVQASGRSPLFPVIALDATAARLAPRHHPGPIAAGDPLFDWRR